MVLDTNMISKTDENMQEKIVIYSEYKIYFFV